MKSPATAAYLGMVTLLGVTALFSHLTWNRPAEPLQRPLTGIGSNLAGWTVAGVEEFDPRQFVASSYIARTYAKESHQLGLLVAFYDSYRSAVNVHTPKNCLPGDGWEIWKTATPDVVFDGIPVTVNQYQIYRMDRRMTVLYWYQTRRRVLASEYRAKLMLVRDGLLERRTAGTFIRIAMPDEPELLPEGYRFAAAVMGEVERCFRQ